MLQRLPTLVAALWWGSLTTIGFIVVPLLFKHLPTPALAGQTAARLFSAQTWVGVGCGLLLLLFSRSNRPQVSASIDQRALIFILGAMLLALLSEFAVAPRIVARENLALWHGLGTALYALQWLLAGGLLWRLAGRPGAAQG